MTPDERAQRIQVLERWLKAFSFVPDTPASDPDFFAAATELAGHRLAAAQEAAACSN